MIIYIALIKTDDNKPFRLVIRDSEKDIKEFLLSIPVMHVVESFTTYNAETKVTKHFSLRDLVEFLKD